MSKIFAKLFPLFDYVYIYQLFEYDSLDFLKWFIKNPLKRNLQQKHRLNLTIKAIALLMLTLTIIVILATLMTFLFHLTWWLLPIIFIMLLHISPLFLALSQSSFTPFEWYSKRKIVKAAKRKLAQNPQLKVIGIVGSFAKTSTKDMLYTLLWKNFRVVKTPKSYNTLLSISRSILNDLKSNTDIFIVEMDAYHPGEIKKLSNLLKPDLAVITSIAPQHLERFGNDMTKLATTQFEVVENIKNGGVLFVNSSDGWSMKLEKNYQLKKVFYGNGDKSAITAKNIKQTPSGLEFNILVNDSTLRNKQAHISIPLFGEHHVMNFLSASAIALQLGLPLETIQQRARLILPTPHRLEVKKQGTFIIIDNSYNTNPISAKSSLKLLKEYPGNEKIVMTPGLIEQGREKSKTNQEFAKIVARVANKVIVVGNYAQLDLLTGLKSESFPTLNTFLVNSTKEGLQLLPKITQPKAVVLIENDLPDQYF